MTEEEKKNSTIDDSLPLFSKWEHWYLLVIIINLIVISSIYFIFRSL